MPWSSIGTISGLDPLGPKRYFPDTVVNCEVFRFRQNFPDRYRPWRGSILLSQVFGADWGIGTRRVIPATKDSLIVKMPILPELVEEGLVVFQLWVSARGRIYPETTWSISGEVLF